MYLPPLGRDDEETNGTAALAIGADARVDAATRLVPTGANEVRAAAQTAVTVGAFTGANKEDLDEDRWMTK